MDPEIPVLSISDLGILRAVEYAENEITVNITPTYSGCPAMDAIQQDIRKILAKNGLERVKIKQVLSPAWTSDWMSRNRKRKTGSLWYCAACLTADAPLLNRRTTNRTLPSVPF